MASNRSHANASIQQAHDRAGDHEEASKDLQPARSVEAVGDQWMSKSAKERKAACLSATPRLHQEASACAEESLNARNPEEALMWSHIDISVVKREHGTLETAWNPISRIVRAHFGSNVGDLMRSDASSPTEARDAQGAQELWEEEHQMPINETQEPDVAGQHIRTTTLLDECAKRQARALAFTQAAKRVASHESGHLFRVHSKATRQAMNAEREVEKYDRQKYELVSRKDELDRKIGELKDRETENRGLRDEHVRRAEEHARDVHELDHQADEICAERNELAQLRYEISRQIDVVDYLRAEADRQHVECERKEEDTRVQTRDATKTFVALYGAAELQEQALAQLTSATNDGADAA